MYRIDSLTEEQLAGQRLMVGFEGRALNDTLADLLKSIPIGGLILFKRNVSDPEQLTTLCQSVQDFALEQGNPPLAISIDQEGGPVARLGPPFSVFPGNRAIGEAQSDVAAREFGYITAKELRGVGINLNFAPVLDVVPEGFDSSVMEDRVFGNNPELVASLGKKVIGSLQKNGVAATAKHFPGIGRTTIDSHMDLPFLDTEREILVTTDLLPFEVAIQAGVAAIMLSHIVYTSLDPTWPAGLSEIIAKDLLRDTMGFTGVTVTDDLDMGAIAKHYDVNIFVERICQAEIDMALICHDRKKMMATYEALLAAIRNSEKVRKKTVVSVNRILKLKDKFAL